MKTGKGQTKNRRSKRQQGLDVSPLIPVIDADNEKNVDAVAEEVIADLSGDFNQQLGADESSPHVAVNEENVAVNDELPTDESSPHDAVDNEEEVQTQQSDNKKRKTRGPSKMRKLAKHIEDKVDVEFTELGDHVGDGSVKLSSFLGTVVREHVPVTLDDWRHLDDLTKHALWEEIQGRFKVTEDWQKQALLKQMGGLWRSSKSKLLRKVRAAKTKLKVLQLKPSNIPSVAVWNNWVKSQTNSKFQR
ncbi:PREDICTED: uncharacterized protein LOC104746827 isoform X2 [Camelina sativa]|uniref:Uncharacterized protein LOC104746827 isoform X2 n=1 Tax=Camelina sativa TaxID=90675 RepID=A0ABM0W767_CAMSA|nr:PREDICTED: uncharacterized protein LOC104746827 isoform X2 [Camelina sativa]